MFNLRMKKLNHKNFRFYIPVGAFLMLIITVSLTAFAQDEQNTQKKEQNDTARATTATNQNNLGSGNLVVPIFPRRNKQLATEDITSLNDSYIVMEDGSVLTVADWILGSLNKSNIRAGMSDYENRLFLGQVARAAAGLDEEMVLHSFQHAGPLRSYIAHTPPEVLQITQGLLSMVIPALQPNWTPAVKGPTIKATDIDRGNAGAILFDRQFSEALGQTVDDFAKAGTIFNMLEEAKKENADKN